MFPPADSRISRRHQVHYLVTLALRLGIVVVLAVLLLHVLSAPPRRGVAVRPRRQLILIDTSASMHRRMLWHAAQMTVLAELHRARPGDMVALYTFDKDITPVLSFAEWRRTPAPSRIALGFSRLTAVSPGWEGTRLGAVLVEAASAMSDSDGAASAFEKQILVITDDRAGGAIQQLDHYKWPSDVELIVRPIRGDDVPENQLRVVELRRRRPAGADTKGTSL